MCDNFSDRDVDDILILLDLLNGIIHVCTIVPCELDVDHTRLAALENDVLYLLYVPLVLCED